jgi:antitoxin HicB
MVAGRINVNFDNFDNFLEAEGIAAEVTGQAMREVVAQLVIDHMAQAGLTKTEMATRMHTSRQALARLLDPEGGGLTLDTLERAASAVGKRVRISFDDVAA